MKAYLSPVLDLFNEEIIIYMIAARSLYLVILILTILEQALVSLPQEHTLQSSRVVQIM